MNKKVFPNALSNELSPYFKGGTPFGFHNLLWQHVMNEVRKNEVYVFYPVITSPSESPLNTVISRKRQVNYLTIGIVHPNVNGYINTFVEFITSDMKLAEQICYKINKQLFAFTTDQVDAFISSSINAAIEEEKNQPKNSAIAEGLRKYTKARQG